MAQRNHAQFHVLDFASAAKIAFFASEVEKSTEGLFQQPVRVELKWYPMQNSRMAVYNRLCFLILLCAPAFAATPAPDAARAQAREMFETLIAFRTSAGLGQTPAMAEHLAEQFRRAGFPAEDVHVLPQDGTASLVVRYRGNGRGGRPILLLAHMDVVTAKPEEWERDPFKLIEERGFFFGRGTIDNKQGVVHLTMTFLRLKKEGFVPTRI